MFASISSLSLSLLVVWRTHSIGKMETLGRKLLELL